MIFDVPSRQVLRQHLTTIELIQLIKRREDIYLKYPYSVYTKVLTKYHFFHIFIKFRNLDVSNHLSMKINIL